LCNGRVVNGLGLISVLTGFNDCFGVSQPVSRGFLKLPKLAIEGFMWICPGRFRGIHAGKGELVVLAGLALGVVVLKGSETKTG